MMAVESLFLTSSSLLLQLLLFQTSLAKPNCTPSACGVFPNISSPLRLNGDPKHCGAFELACENNVTSFNLNSNKFYVKEINYSNDFGGTRMRLVDASIKNDTCYIPNSTAIINRVTYSLGDYLAVTYFVPIYFMSCPHPLKNSSGFTETTPCQTPNSRFTYIKVGDMNASEVRETCRVDVVAMTSWTGFKDFKNASFSRAYWGLFNYLKKTSLEEINSALLYGFEIDILPWGDISKWGKFNDQYRDKVKLPLLILLAIAVVFGAAISPVMAILGFIVVLGFLLSFSSYQFNSRILWWDTFDPLNIYTGRGGFGFKIGSRSSASSRWSNYKNAS